MYNRKLHINSLLAKFDNDVAKRSKGQRILLAIDQLLSVILFNSSQDETMSSYIGRQMEANTATKFQTIVCTFLRFVESRHCLRSKGE